MVYLQAGVSTPCQLISISYTNWQSFSHSTLHELAPASYHSVVVLHASVYLNTFMALEVITIMSLCTAFTWSCIPRCSTTLPNCLDEKISHCVMATVAFGIIGAVAARVVWCVGCRYFLLTQVPGNPQGGVAKLTGAVVG